MGGALWDMSTEGRKGKFFWVSTSGQEPHQTVLWADWLAATTALLSRESRESLETDAGGTAAQKQRLHAVHGKKQKAALQVPTP